MSARITSRQLMLRRCSRVVTLIFGEGDGCKGREGGASERGRRVQFCVSASDGGQQGPRRNGEGGTGPLGAATAGRQGDFLSAAQGEDGAVSEWPLLAKHDCHFCIYSHNSLFFVPLCVHFSECGFMWIFLYSKNGL